MRIDHQLFYRRFSFLIALILVSTMVTQAQYIPHHTDHEDVYDWIHDMQIAGYCDFNPAVGTLSREQIVDILMRVDSAGSLNKVQQKELNFWLRDFGKEISNGRVEKKPKLFKDKYLRSRSIKKRVDLLYFANDRFQITLNPIVSGDGGVQLDGNLRRYQWFGGEMYGRIGKGFGYYFSARDYLEQPNWYADPNLAPQLGGVYRKSIISKAGLEYYEVRGGLTYSWKWGEIGLVKDHFQIGTTNNQEILFSKRAPSYPRIHLQVRPTKWLELTYTFGMLNSEVVDSARSYVTSSGVFRDVFHRKYVAANLLTFKPIKHLYISVGNSVIIADNNLNVAHFIPIMFYTALDQSFNGQNNAAGQNSQIYGDISWNAFGYVRLYASMMIDEIRLSKIHKPAEQRNSWAWTVGFRTRAFTSWNLKVYGSYTRIRPGVYSHYINTLDYSHAGYTLGHFLGQNSDQIVFGLQLRPIAKLRVIAEWQRWRKGPEHQFGVNPSNLSGAKFMERSISVSDKVGIRVRYQLLNDLSFQLTADYLRGSSNGDFPFPGVSEKGVSDLWFGLGIHVGR